MINQILLCNCIIERFCLLTILKAKTFLRLRLIYPNKVIFFFSDEAAKPGIVIPPQEETLDNAEQPENIANEIEPNPDSENQEKASIFFIRWLYLRVSSFIQF